jgi:hypothetical protein
MKKKKTMRKSREDNNNCVRELTNLDMTSPEGKKAAIKKIRRIDRRYGREVVKGIVDHIMQHFYVSAILLFTALENHGGVCTAKMIINNSGHYDRWKDAKKG